MKLIDKIKDNESLAFYIGAIIAAIFLFLVAAFVGAQQPRTRGKEAKEPTLEERKWKEAHVSAPQPKAKIASVKSKSLVRFKHSIEIPRGDRPAARREGNWHWHPWYGWVLLPVSREYADLKLILPLDFELPETITYYTPPTTEVIVVCPHCGQPVKIIVEH